MEHPEDRCTCHPAQSGHSEGCPKFHGPESGVADPVRVSKMSREDLIKFAVAANELLGDCRRWLKSTKLIPWEKYGGDETYQSFKKIHDAVEEFVWTDDSLAMQRR